MSSKDDGAAKFVEKYEASFPILQTKFGETLLKYCVPSKTTLWRVKTLRTKEPDTVAWISAFEPGSVFVDVGANVGMYTILAARHVGAKVFAFEPEAQNFALLNRNILANELQDQVIAFCLALTDRTKVDRLYLSAATAGGSCHSFGAEVGFDLRPRSSPFAQGCVGMPLDLLVDDGVIEAPNYLKVDVDGFEHLVFAGARQVLRNPALREICVELNPHLDEHREAIETLKMAGFDYDTAQVERAARQQGPFKGVGEYVFKRR